MHLKCDINKNISKTSFNSEIKHENQYSFIDENEENDSNETVYDKIKNINFKFNNNIINTTSCCFWDTEPFTTPPFYIPCNMTDDNIDVYGHFCCPECAVAYLFSEKIDSSVKWERYSFINNLYNFNKASIKPSPKPHYILKKFYGNLDISEYREMTKKNELVVINKPITKLTPEICKTNTSIIKNI